MKRISGTVLSAIFVMAMLPCGLFAASDSELQRLFDNIRKAETVDNDSAIIAANNAFDKTFGERIRLEDAFYAPLDSLTQVGKIMSDDGKLRIISWNYKLSGGKYGYNCYFLYKERKNKPAKVYRLSTTKAFRPADNKSYNAANWYGSLYYSATRYRDGYLLLGFGTCNDISKIKLIEPLTIEEKRLKFGEKIFKPYAGSNKTVQRVIFEYSSAADMNLSYDKNGRRFVFDHLSPEQASMEGMYQYYGPDFSVDALTVKKKFWTLMESIDIRNNF